MTIGLYLRNKIDELAKGFTCVPSEVEVVPTLDVAVDGGGDPGGGEVGVGLGTGPRSERSESFLLLDAILRTELVNRKHNSHLKTKISL